MKIGLLFFMVLLMAGKPHAESSQKDPLKRVSAKERLQRLKSVLETYHKRNIYIRMDIFSKIKVLNQRTRKSGYFYIQDHKFRLKTDSKPSSLSLFDGSYLWHQPNLDEKMVFKLENHPFIKSLPNLFHKDRFFKIFKVLSSAKLGDFYLFQIQPLSKISEIDRIHLTVSKKQIQRFEIFWSGLESSEEYIVTQQWFKKSFSRSLFEFSGRGFEILSRIP